MVADLGETGAFSRQSHKIHKWACSDQDRTTGKLLKAKPVHIPHRME